MGVKPADNFGEFFKTRVFFRKYFERNEENVNQNPVINIPDSIFPKEAC